MDLLGSSWAISRVELHLHLDGAADRELLFNVSRLRNLSLPGIGIPKSVKDIDRIVDSKSAFERFDVINNILGGCEKAAFYIGQQMSYRQKMLGTS